MTQTPPTTAPTENPYGNLPPMPTSSSTGTVQAANAKVTPNSKQSSEAYAGIPEGMIQYQINPQTGQPEVDANGNPILAQHLLQAPGGPFYVGPRMDERNTVVQGTEGNAQGISGIGTPYNDQPYHEGDMWGPELLPKNQITDLQNALVAAGLLSKSTMTPGSWGYPEAKAYETVLAEANAVGASAQDMLNRLAADPAAGTGGTYRPPLGLQNPADIQAAFATQGQNITGGYGLSQGEANAFQKSFQAQEQQSLQQYNQVDPTSTRAARLSYTSAPNPDAAARAYLLQNNQGDIKAFQTAQNALQFANMLKAL